MTPDPVNKIRWWGSFKMWTDAVLPPEAPASFNLAIWTDVPAGMGTDFSHPGVVLWQVEAETFTWEFVGWDLSPIGGEIEATFLFEFVIPPGLEFLQPGDGGIYWLSIAAGYPAGAIVEHPWGWKTRPRDAASPAPDDAVIIIDPTAPSLGSQFVSGWPIWFPTPVDSWDCWNYGDWEKVGDSSSNAMCTSSSTVGRSQSCRRRGACTARTSTTATCLRRRTCCGRSIC